MMPIDTREGGGNVVDVALTGTVVKEDYGPFVKEFTRLTGLHGKLRVLLDMTGFHGWDASALWQEVKFDMKHLGDLERLAVVGEARWQHAISSFAKPFTPAEVRYFDGAQTEEARRWISA
jgi:hypothetical protein